MLFAAGMVLLVLVAVEISSFAALSALHRRVWGYADLHASLRQTADAASELSLGDGRGFNTHAHDGYTLHPYLGYVKDREATIVERADREPLSAYGFHDDAGVLVRRRVGNELVVGLFGGSVARNFGRGNGAQHLAERLRSSPRYAGRDVVFTTPALGGFKQPQQLLSFAYLLSLGAQFDLVINLDGFNEVALPGYENTPKGVHPFFPRSWYFLAQELQPEVRLAVGEIAYLRARRERIAAQLARSPLAWSFTVGLLRHGLEQRRQARIQALRESLVATPAESSPYNLSGPQRAYPDTQRLFEDLASMWSQGSRAMAGLAAGHGIPYYHFLQPNQYVPDSKPLTEREREFAFDEGHAYQRSVIRGYPLLREEGEQLRSEGVAFFDLTGVFAEHPEGLYVDTCCHFSQEGDIIVAEAIARALLDEVTAGEAGRTAAAGPGGASTAPSGH